MDERLIGGGNATEHDAVHGQLTTDHPIVLTAGCAADQVQVTLEEGAAEPERDGGGDHV